MAGAYPWPSTPTQCLEENSISTLRLKSSSSSNYRGLPNIPMSTPGSCEGICSRMGRMWSRTMCLSRKSSICPMETRHLMRSCKGEEKKWSWDQVRREGGMSRNVLFTRRESSSSKTTESSLVLIWMNLCQTTFSELIKMVWMPGKWIIIFPSNLNSLHFLFRCPLKPSNWSICSNLLKAYSTHTCTCSSPRWYQPQCRVQSYVVQWSASWNYSPPCWQMWAGYSHTAPAGDKNRVDPINAHQYFSSPSPRPLQ